MPSADIKSEPGTDTRVMVVPRAAVDNISGEGARVLQLRHPRTGQGASFWYNSGSKTLCEVLRYEEEHRSWFIGDKVVGDGRMLLATPVHPAFLALPYLARAERLVPLDQMLEDAEFPDTEAVLVEVLTEARLGLVADSKGSKDLNVWKYSEDKTLAWLEAKVTRLAAVFSETEVDTSGGAASSIYRAASSGDGDPHHVTRFALGVLQEYLDPDLGQKLEARLDLPKVEAKAGTKRLSSLDTEEEENKPRKKVKSEGPIEDYSKSYKKPVVKDETSSKDKALAQSAKGTKSIMSFFGKK